MNPPLAQFTVEGNLLSMKNSRRIVRNPKTGRVMVIKSRQALEYEKSFLLQVPKRVRLSFTDPVSLEVVVWYQSRRSDLDIELLKDLLQKADVIGNDRQIVHMRAWKLIDRVRPRAFIVVHPASVSEGDIPTVG